MCGALLTFAITWTVVFGGCFTPSTSLCPPPASDGCIFYIWQILSNCSFVNPASAPYQVENLFQRFERAIELPSLEGRCIVMSGDQLQWSLREERSIISPSQMIKHDFLTFTCSEWKTKPSAPTRNMKPGLVPSYPPKSKFYTQIEAANI